MGVFITIFVLMLTFLLTLSSTNATVFLYNYEPVPVWSGTVSRDFTAYPELCLQEGTIGIGFQWVLAGGKFGIKEVRINDVQVSVTKYKEGYCSEEWGGPSSCTDSFLEGTFPISAIKEGSNRIEIDYYTPCYNLGNYFVCVAAGVLPHEGSKISATIYKGAHANPLWEIELDDSDVTLDVVTPKGRIETGEQFQISVNDIYLVGIHDRFYQRKTQDFLGSQKSIFACFENANVNWNMEFVGQAKSGSNRGSVTFTAPKLLSDEAMSNFAECMAYAVGGNDLCTVDRLGAVYEVKINVPPTQFFTKVSEDCQFFLRNYLGQPLHEIQSCANVKINEAKQRDFVRLFPKTFRPNLKMQSEPTVIPVYPESCAVYYGREKCPDQAKYPFPLNVKILAEFSADGLKIPNLYFVPSIESLGKRSARPEDWRTTDQTGRFEIIFEPRPEVLTSPNPISFEVQGPYTLPNTACVEVSGATTGSCCAFEHNGQHFYMDPTSFFLSIPRTGCTAIDFKADVKYEVKDLKLSCTIKANLNAPECEGWRWEISMAEQVCKGTFKAGETSASCEENLEFETPYATKVNLRAEVDGIEKTMSVICGELEIAEYICPIDACSLRDGKYHCDVTKCEKVKE